MKTKILLLCVFTLVFTSCNKKLTPTCKPFFVVKVGYDMSKDVPLCVVTIKELTGKDSARTKEVFDALKPVGKLIPQTIVPLFLKQYKTKEQKLFHILTEPENLSKYMSSYFVWFDPLNDRSEKPLNEETDYQDWGWSGGIHFIFAPLYK